MSDLSFLTEYIMPVIVGICLCVGFIVKKWVDDIDNKYIPTICAFLGLIIAIWMNDWSITPTIVLNGLVSGMASTGLHQLLKQYKTNIDSEKDYIN